MLLPLHTPGAGEGEGHPITQGLCGYWLVETIGGDTMIERSMGVAVGTFTHQCVIFRDNQMCQNDTLVFTV